MIRRKYAKLTGLPSLAELESSSKTTNEKKKAMKHPIRTPLLIGLGIIFAAVIAVAFHLAKDPV